MRQVQVCVSAVDVSKTLQHYAWHTATVGLGITRVMFENESFFKQTTGRFVVPFLAGRQGCPLRSLSARPRPSGKSRHLSPRAKKRENDFFFFLSRFFGTQPDVHPTRGTIDSLAPTRVLLRPSTSPNRNKSCMFVAHTAEMKASPSRMLVSYAQ